MVTFRPGIQSDNPFYNFQTEDGISGRQYKKDMMHESFPPQGEEKRAHEGSQSESPSKEEYKPPLLRN